MAVTDNDKKKGNRLREEALPYSRMVCSSIKVPTHECSTAPGCLNESRHSHMNTVPSFLKYQGSPTPSGNKGGGGKKRLVVAVTGKVCHSQKLEAWKAR